VCSTVHRGCWQLTEFPSNRNWAAPSFICAITMNPASSGKSEILWVDSASTSPPLRWEGVKPRVAREAVSLVRVDGPVQDSILGEILQIKAITEAKLLRFAD